MPDAPADDPAHDPADDPALRAAVDAAAGYAEAVRATARFVEQLRDLPGPGDLAEYAHLLGQEESAREARTGALVALDLDVPSLEPDPE